MANPNAMDVKTLCRAALALSLSLSLHTLAAQDRDGRKIDKGRMLITIDENGVTVNGRRLDRYMDSSLERLKGRLDSLPSQDFNLPDLHWERRMPESLAPLLDRLERFRRDLSPRESKRPKVGLQLADTKDGKGVRVVSVETGSPPAEAGIREGDIIVRIDGRRVHHTDDARAGLLQEDGSDDLRIGVLRKGREMEFRIDLSPKPTAEVVCPPLRARANLFSFR